MENDRRINVEKILLLLSTVFLVIIQSTVLYFWIMNWRKLVTYDGLIVWSGSIIFGLIVHRFYLSLNAREKSFEILKKVHLISTSITIFLGILSLLIESVTSSMP